MMAAYDAFTEEVKAAGAFVGGEALQPTSTATTVRVRDGEPLLTDGPFAETREQLGGYYLLECDDLDEAIRWAAKIPGAATGCVEVRPIMDFEDGGRRGRRRRRGGARLSAPGRPGPPVPARVGAGGRGARAGARRPGPRRGGGPGRLRDRARALAARRRAREPGGVDRHGRPQPGARPDPRRPALRRARARSSRGWTRSRAATSRGGRGGEPDRRRAPAAGLHLLPPGARAGGARRADAAPARRPDDRRGGARVPRLGGRDGPARRARQGEDPRGADRLRAPARRGPARAARLRARDALPRLQRGLRRDGRRRADPARAVRRGDPARARAVRADARRARGARPARADAAARLAPGGPRRTRTGRLVLLADQDRAALGPRGDRRGPRADRARAGARRPRPLRGPGRDRGRARPGRAGGGHGLGGDRRRLRAARADRSRPR